MSQSPNRSPFGEKLQFAVEKIKQSGNRSTVLASLSGAARSLLVSFFSNQSDSPLLIVGESFEAAERIQQDLLFFLDESMVSFFPYWDTIPYDNQSPDKDVVAVRFNTLNKILTQKTSVVVTTPYALMHRILPPNSFLENSQELSIGDVLERDDLLRKLVNMGFVRVDMVEDKGEFSVRGELIDIFPISEPSPVRIDFFDNEIESIKHFDVETQRSTSEIVSLNVNAAQEIVFSEESTNRALDKLLALKAGSLPQTYSSIKESIQACVPFSGMESLLPIFYSQTSTLLDYFPEDPTILFFEKSSVKDRAEKFFTEVMAEYEYSRQEENPTLNPDVLYLTDELLFSTLKRYKCLDLQSMNMEAVGSTDMSTVDNSAIRSLAVSVETAEQNSLHHVFNQLKKWNGEGVRVAIAVNSISRSDRIRQMFEEIGLIVPVLTESSYLDRQHFFSREFAETDASFCIIPVPITAGFRWVDETGNTRLALISDEEIFGTRQKHRRIKKDGLKHFFSSLGDLNVGDYVVHVEYGIGKYEGLKKITAGQHESDYLVIVYQGGDKVYVPVDKFNLVLKYAGGDAEKAKINKLGGKTWNRTKSKVKSEIDDIAEELVQINAERQAKKGIAFSPDSSLMNEFTLAFPYQETEDQERAIRDVLQDMESERPMDRLVCGDVGFGKTEVAMRAAYKAVIDGYQVGILVPTTILAQQHYDSFCKRFENTPVNVGMVSRFRTPKSIKITVQKLKEGKIDVMIGTHRLLSKDVIFKKLGLLVIDEEQRFGVKHKERIKQIQTTVDSLILSATPIPRTLHMSLVGIRDISVINTPPMDRRAIRTRLLKFNDYVIQEAVQREIRRNGQVFFIHNRVDSIYQVGQYLQKIMPRVRIGVGHGQMAERELEKVMHDFIHGEYDVLLSTTIVESGLDIPNVNTIIVNNADQFGLSQLYQLRGRVGRSHAQAYSYLMTAREKVLSETARKRLQILQELNHLGAGFKIANYDLELRGAGNVLGSQQSGHIVAVGFELYTAMIEEAVEKIKKGDQIAVQGHEIKLNLMADASLPEDYINSMNQRLDAYKDISSCKSEEELWDVRSSLEDRFGRLPESAINLFNFIQIKLLSLELQIVQIDQSYESLEILFSDDFKPEPTAILKFLTHEIYKSAILPNNKLKVSLMNAAPEEILRFLQVFRKEVLTSPGSVN